VAALVSVILRPGIPPSSRDRDLPVILRPTQSERRI